MQTIVILSVMLTISHVFADDDNYIFPVPDGGVKNPSPPSIIGILKGITRTEIKVQSPENSDIQTVTYNDDTQMFTLAGGIVWPDRLVLDGPIEIWFTHESIIKMINPPIAAVVRVESRKVR